MMSLTTSPGLALAGSKVALSLRFAASASLVGLLSYRNSSPPGGAARLAPARSRQTNAAGQMLGWAFMAVDPQVGRSSTPDRSEHGGNKKHRPERIGSFI